MLRVRRHKVGRAIGTAGLLSTFEAEHEDGRAVHLRVFNAELEPPPPVVARFEREAEIASRVKHPSIAAPIDWSAADPVHVSTAPIVGASLEAVCAAAPTQRLDAAIVVALGADLAGALSTAHAAGLVHGGLSPAVIVLGVDGYPHVTDFALARFLTSMSSSYSQVMRGAIQCLAPEHLTAPDTVGPATDVFALGVVLYRALTAKEPFEAPSALGMSIRLSIGKVTPVDSHGVSIPAPLSELVMKMLAAAPGDRPAMNDVAGALSSMAQLRSAAWRDTLRRLAAAHTQPQAESQAPEVESAQLEEAPALPTTAAPAPFVAPPAPSPAPALPTAAAPASFEAPLDFPLPSFAEPTSDEPTLATPPFNPPAAPSPIEPPTAEHDMRSILAGGDTLVPEDEPPDYLRDAPGDTELLAAAFDDDAVPKTVVMRDPRAPSIEAASAASWAAVAARPKAQPLVQPSPPLSPPPSPPTLATAARAAVPEWAVWAAIGAGALALLGATVTLVVLIAG